MRRTAVEGNVAGAREGSWVIWRPLSDSTRSRRTMPSPSCVRVRGRNATDKQAHRVRHDRPLAAGVRETVQGPVRAGRSEEQERTGTEDARLEP